MASNFIDDLFQAIGGGASELFGGTRLGRNMEQNKLNKNKDRRAEEDQELNRRRIEQLILNDKSLNAKRDALLTKQGGKDPRVVAAEDIGKVQSARDKFDPEKIDPGTAAFFDDVESGIKSRVGFEEETTTEIVKPESSRTVGFFEGAFTGKKRGDVITTPAETKETKRFGKDIRSDFTDGTDVLGSGKATPVSSGDAALSKKHNIPIDDFAQESTAVAPKERKARSLEELGIQNADDQQAFQEMQNSVKDKDLRKEAEQDPEGMQRLLEYWKQKKLNKTNIKKAFSALQSQARNRLGIS